VLIPHSSTPKKVLIPHSSVLIPHTFDLKPLLDVGVLTSQETYKTRFYKTWQIQIQFLVKKNPFSKEKRKYNKREKKDKIANT